MNRQERYFDRRIRVANEDVITQFQFHMQQKWGSWYHYDTITYLLNDLFSNCVICNIRGMVVMYVFC